jgi:hypothetical protein
MSSDKCKAGVSEQYSRQPSFNDKILLQKKKIVIYNILSLNKDGVSTVHSLQPYVYHYSRVHSNKSNFLFNHFTNYKLL